MLYSLILAAAFAIQPEPSYFVIDIDTNTDVSLYIDGHKVKAGKEYKIDSDRVLLVIRYVDGDVVEQKAHIIKLYPGKRAKINIKLIVTPPVVVGV